MPDPARRLDPPAIRLGPIPEALKIVGDDAALEAWWEVICTCTTAAQIAGLAEAMAELIERDPEAALADMRACIPKPLDLDWLADFAARCCKSAGTPSDAQSFWLLADQLQLHCEQQAAKDADGLGSCTHLTPELIARLARESAEGMDLLERRIEQLVEMSKPAARECPDCLGAGWYRYGPNCRDRECTEQGWAHSCHDCQGTGRLRVVARRDVESLAALLEGVAREKTA